MASRERVLVSMEVFLERVGTYVRPEGAVDFDAAVRAVYQLAQLQHGEDPIDDTEFDRRCVKLGGKYSFLEDNCPPTAYTYLVLLMQLAHGQEIGRAEFRSSWTGHKKK